LSFAPIFVFFAPFLVYESSPLLDHDFAGIVPTLSGTRAVGMAAKDQPFCWITNMHTTKFGLGNI
jgi:hypothetical protein